MADGRLSRLRRNLGASSTTLAGAVDVMGKEKSEKALDKIEEFTQLVVVIVSKLEDVMGHFVRDEYGELAQAADELDRLESQADSLKADIQDTLATGGIFFMGRADLARLVTSVDAIANYSAGAADRIAMRRFSLTPEVNALLVEMVKIDIEAVSKLRDAVLAMRTNMRKAMGEAGLVDKIESKADSVFASIYRLMFDMDIDFKTFHQLKAIIERLESIADKASQNAELIRHMMLEYLEES